MVETYKIPSRGEVATTFSNGDRLDLHASNLPLNYNRLAEQALELALNTDKQRNSEGLGEDETYAPEAIAQANPEIIKENTYDVLRRSGQWITWARRSEQNQPRREITIGSTEVN